jgi:PGM1 C-terminal domain
MRDFISLQSRLGPTWRLSQPPGGTEHVRVVLPSYNLGASALRHYAYRLPALEHRFLVEILQLARVEAGTLVFVFCQAPGAEVIDYYLSLLPPETAARVRPRIYTVVVPDDSGRPVAAKLLDRPDLLDHICDIIGGRPAFIEPWNVTGDEVAVAVRLQAPVNGTVPELWPLGFKSSGRRLLAAAGIPTPSGTEGVRTAEDLRLAIACLRQAHPGLAAAVVKLDNSVSGDGNQVIALQDSTGSPASPRMVAERVASMPDWYLAELALGGVVEAQVAGEDWSSPSVQIEITPEGQAMVVATHEQILGGDNGQVYQGCHFPARREYARRLTKYGQRAGRLLAGHQVRGMVSIDFVAARDRGQPWRLCALEVNLRRGGTTAPIVVLSSLLPGRYDAHGRWRLSDGSARYYCATDHLGDPRWTGLLPGQVIDGVRCAGLEFDRRTGTGVVLHMLSGIAIDGRFGMTAVGGSTHEADQMFAAVRPVVNRLCATWAASTAATRAASKADLLRVLRQETRPQAAQRTGPVRMSLQAAAHVVGPFGRSACGRRGPERRPPS